MAPLCFLVAWFLMLAVGRPMVDWLKRLKGMKWSPREDTPDSHLAKAGTPSMGGIGLIGTALATYFAVVGLSDVAHWFTIYSAATSVDTPLQVVTKLCLFPLIVALHWLVGLIDDWSKARGKGGLKSRQKLAFQIVLAALFVAVGHFTHALSSTSAPQTPVPFANFAPASVFELLVVAIILIGTSNAVNLTDGIDGLAAGLTVQCGFAMLAVQLSLGTYQHSYDWTNPELCYFWMALAGSALGFLAFNRYPAKVFMGDTGSLALGAALGAGAALTHTLFLLPFIGFVFYIEMFSVISQVAYFKYTKKKYGEGRRIFKRAPLHHHFELAGWSEWRVVGTFWLINAATSAIGLLLWSKGVLPQYP